MRLQLQRKMPERAATYNKEAKYTYIDSWKGTAAQKLNGTSREVTNQQSWDKNT